MGLRTSPHFPVFRGTAGFLFAMPATATPTAADRLAPLPTESQVQFLARVMRSVPGTTEHRNAVAQAAWANSGRDAEFERIVRDRFPASKFRRVRNRPVFVEHTKSRTKRDPVTGQETEVLERYDRDALAAMVDRCNERILDTADFSPITEGHTPDPEDIAKGAKMPDVLGYSGPFRLGVIGNKKPRYAIFCDEFHHNEAVPRLERLTRRSPEVWLEDRMQDRFFDPIAALGAETPRLDTGLGRFGRRADGRLVEKYSAVAVAPSGANTFIPSDGGERKKSYAAEPDPAATNGAKPMLSPEDIKQIVDAIEQLDWVQGVKGLLASQGGGEPTGMDQGAMAPPPADNNPPPVDANAAGAQPMGGSAMPAAPQPPPMAPAAATAVQPYACDDDDKSMMSKYAAGEVSDDEMMEHLQGRKQSYAASLGTGSATDPQPGKPAGEADVADRAAQYSRSDHDTRVRYARLEQEHNALKASVDKLQLEKRDQYRRAKLAERQAEGFVFDLDDEIKHAADMTDQQFERHLTVVQRYEKAPLGLVLHAPPIENPQTAKYAKDRVEAIKKLAADKHILWDEAVREYDAHQAALSKAS